MSLQSLDPIFVNFLLPQQQLAQVQTGLPVRVVTDALPGEVVDGKITAINPEVDTATRNIRIQATIPNAEERLRPGMFVNVAVVLPAKTRCSPFRPPPSSTRLTAIRCLSWKRKRTKKAGKTGRAVRQQFAQLGEKRGDFVAVVSGLKEGDTVVSTGVFKLRNGQSVIVDNTLAPEFKLAPKPDDN